MHYLYHIERCFKYDIFIFCIYVSFEILQWHKVCHPHHSGTLSCFSLTYIINIDFQGTFPIQAYLSLPFSALLILLICPFRSHSQYKRADSHPSSEKGSGRIFPSLFLYQQVSDCRIVLSPGSGHIQVMIFIHLQPSSYQALSS